LRGGSWGVRANVKLQPGDVVTVTAKSGKKWRAMIDQIVWSDDFSCLCSVKTGIAEPTDRDY